MASVHVDFR